MIVEGIWRFSLTYSEADADVPLQHGLLVFDFGNIRSLDTPPTMAGDYRINGAMLTCHVRSMLVLPGSRSHIFELTGELNPDRIYLRGIDVEEAGIRFAAKLMRFVQDAIVAAR